MPRHQITLEAHGKLIELCGEFTEAVLPRSRFRVHRAHDALQAMGDVLNRLDSFQTRSNGNGKTKGTGNGKARLD